MANEEQAAIWDGPGGAHRLANPDQDDAETALHDARFREVAAIAPGERVLDVGCGTGQSSRAAARAAVGGSVLGVDLSSGMLAQARERSAAEGLANVAYEQADAQVHRFPEEYFDVVISRFGVMFFADPAAAFANLARALRPGGRLVLLVWQACELNESWVAIRAALGDAPPPPGLNPYSLADPETVRAVLAAAGFTGIDFIDVRKPIYYGRDPASAFDFVRGFWSTGNALARMEPAAAEQALARLRAMVAAYDTGEGVWFDARTWIITAVRRS